MTLKEFLDVANAAYPDGFLSEYYDEDGEEKPGSGDSLAQFIVHELIETFSQFEETDDFDGLIDAAQATLLAASEEIGKVIDALDTLRPEQIEEPPAPADDPEEPPELVP